MRYRVPPLTSISASVVLPAQQFQHIVAAILPKSCLIKLLETRLRVGIIPIVDLIPFRAALELGYFAEENLEVDTTPAPGGAAMLPALAAGQFDIAFSNTVSILLGAQQGLDFRIVAGSALNADAPPDVLGLYVRADSGIKSAADLVGKRISSNTRNNIIWLRIAAWLEKHGTDPKKVNFVEVPFPQTADALLGAQIDAGALYEPFLSAAIETHSDKLVRLGWPFSETSKASLIAQFAARQAFIDSNSDVIARFSRAHAKGVAWVNARRGTTELEPIVQNLTRIPPERQRKMTLCAFDNQVEAAKVDEIIELMGRHGIGGKLPATKELIHETARR